MDVVDRYRQEEVLVSRTARVVSAAGEEREQECAVLVEHDLDVYVNEVLTMRVVCTPSHLVDLVVGRLFSEGIIEGVADVESVYVCEYGTRARVTLRERSADFTRKVSAEVVPTCCTGNKLYNRYFDEGRPLEKVRPIAWSRSWVFAAAAAFSQDSPLHRRTYGTHSCYLVADGHVVCCREDLGRHNAFDKVIGWALREGVDLTQTLVFSSGRIPVDMVTKAIRAGIPVLATKAVPTDSTIELARRYDLTLICSAHPDSMRVYCDPAATGGDALALTGEGDSSAAGGDTAPGAGDSETAGEGDPATGAPASPLAPAAAGGSALAKPAATGARAAELAAR